MISDGAGILSGKANGAAPRQLVGTDELDPLDEALDIAASARLHERVEDLRYKVTRKIEQDLAEAFPEIFEIATAGLNEAAKRRKVTERKYWNTWAKFRDWAAEIGFREMPYPAPLVANYLIERAAAGYSLQNLGLVRAAISHYHLEHNFQNPSDDVLVAATIKFIKQLGGPDGGKELPAVVAA